MNVPCQVDRERFTWETGSLQLDRGAGMQILHPVAKGFLQYIILGLACAVTGEVMGGEFHQLMQGIAQLPTVRIHSDEVETAEEIIRPEPA